MEGTDEADTMMLPETAEDFSPIVSSTFEEPEPEAKTGEEHDLEGYADDEKHFHFGFKDDESLPIFSFD